MKSEQLGITWRRGMSVVRLFYGINDYRDAALAEVTQVDLKTKTVFINHETGITFDRNGHEKENFFPGMRCEITPL